MRGKRLLLMFLLLGIILFFIALTVRRLIDARTARTATTASTTSQQTETEARYAVGSTVVLCWQQPAKEPAMMTVQSVLKLLKLPFDNLTDEQVKKLPSGYMKTTLYPAGGTWQMLMLAIYSLQGDRIGTALSKRIDGPVIAFMEYDQDCWGYTLFVQGKVRGFFWNAPQFADEDPETCKGDPALLAKTFQVDIKQLAPYLQHIDIEKYPEDNKAFPDDEYPLVDHWVRVDVMRRLGIHYPDLPQEKGQSMLLHDPKS